MLLQKKNSNNNVECDGLLKQCEQESKKRDSDGIFKMYGC